MCSILSRLDEQSEWYSDGHGPLHAEAARKIRKLIALTRKDDPDMPKEPFDGATPNRPSPAEHRASVDGEARKSIERAVTEQFMSLTQIDGDILATAVLARLDADGMRVTRKLD